MRVFHERTANIEPEKSNFKEYTLVDRNKIKRQGTKSLFFCGIIFLFGGAFCVAWSSASVCASVKMMFTNIHFRIPSLTLSEVFLNWFGF